MDMLATLLAIGIDPKKAVIFHQDDVGSSGLACSSSVLLNFLFFRVCGLESVPHRVSLDIQLRHAHWKVTENDDMEGMHLSPPPPSS